MKIKVKAIILCVDCVPIEVWVRDSLAHAYNKAVKIAIAQLPLKNRTCEKMILFRKELEETQLIAKNNWSIKVLQVTKHKKQS